MTDADRIERYRQGLANAKVRLARCQAQDDEIGIAANRNTIAKYEKRLREPLRPLPPSIPLKWP